MLSSATGLGVKDTIKAEMIEHANTEGHVYMYFINKGTCIARK